MSSWARSTVLLCNYGFLKELRPGVPFLTPYLIADKNFTDAQLYGRIYPFWTYSYLFLLVPAFALTDLLRYKPVILAEVLCLIGSWCALLFGTTVAHMQLMQVLFGASSAAEVAYFAYIYAAVDSEHYAAVTSYVRAATLAGKLAAYGLSQVLVSTGVMGGLYAPLNYASLGALALALPCAALLPKVRQAVGADTDTDSSRQCAAGNSNNRSRGGHTPALVREASHYFKATLVKLRSNYGNRLVLRWSLWWALATCGFLQVGNYIQTLWATMQTGQSDVLNGVVEAVNMLLGMLVALCMQYVRLNWRLVGEPVLAACTLLMAGLLLAGALSHNLYVAYAVYVAVCVAYQMLITVATYNVSRHTLKDTYGLVIGCNTLAALLLQTVLTLAVADAHGLALHIAHQFCVYAAFFACIGLLYAAMAAAAVVDAGGCRTYMALACANEPDDADDEGVQQEDEGEHGVEDDDGAQPPAVVL